MTKEELEKEAEEKYSEVDREFIDCQDEGEVFNIGYLAGAEPREKRIAELEATNKKISDECHKLVNTLEKKQNENKLLETQNIKLQAEVSRLTIKNAELETIVRNTKAVDESFALQTIQLTRAKEIIKLLLWDLRNKSYEPVKDVERAEQFLNSEVKK